MESKLCNFSGGNGCDSMVLFDSSHPQEYWVNAQIPCLSSSLSMQVPPFSQIPSRSNTTVPCFSQSLSSLNSQVPWFSQSLSSLNAQVPSFSSNPSREDIRPFHLYSDEYVSFEYTRSNGSTCELVEIEQFDDPHPFVDPEIGSLCNDTDPEYYQTSLNHGTPTDGLVGFEESDDADPFSDPVLKYINEMLMNEDVEEKLCMYQECSALQATVKPFYDILGENYSLCPLVDSSPSSSNYSSNLSQGPSSDKEVKRENFDKVLLSAARNGKDFSLIQKEVLQSSVQKKGQNDSVMVSPRGKKPRNHKEVVDLRTLSVHCAEAIAVNDTHLAQDILKQIRQHSSPCGDGTQRLAYYFAESLEARLSGTGGYLYTRLYCDRPSAAEILKAYHLFIVACPFTKGSFFFCNKTILDLAQNASCLHIVDYGILYGFQWPSLIQQLSARPNGPPRLKITGIDFPQPGCNRSERIEETGRRLADYARSFGIPFEYHAIATKWEDVEPENLSLSNDELLIVNCSYRLRNLMDETASVESPRNIVLSNIRRMNPSVFIQGVVNGAYNAPFFVTRCKEALFHYSALFDTLEATVPREHPERMTIEKEMWGREILNIVACEGLERVERAEAYKRWQIRTQRSGFEQLSLNKEILSRVRVKAKSLYHKDFVVDEDGKWMVLGWKGRIIVGLSTWRPSS